MSGMILYGSGQVEVETTVPRITILSLPHATYPFLIGFQLYWFILQVENSSGISGCSPSLPIKTEMGKTSFRYFLIVGCKKIEIKA